MAGLFASLSVRRAVDKLASFLPASLGLASSSTSSVRQDLEDLRRLERTMRRILATLHDAEEHWDIREVSAKLRLKELAYDAEDVVEEYENEVDRCKLEALDERSAWTNHKRKRQEENDAYSIDAGMVPVPNELAVQARKIIDRFDEIKDYSDNFTLSENDGERLFAPDISSLRKTSSVVHEKSILGREEDKNNIVEKLLPRESHNIACPVSVLAIVGMGGLGKTTLAQLVYNDPRVRQSFDVYAWVCVSEQFDVSSITKNIISSLTGQKCDPSELGNLQEKLVDKIKEKRVLLVLDDVWNERRDSWELLCMPMSTTSLCKIVVTTRSEAVARLVQTMPFYHLDCLSSDESWSLFKQVAFAVHQDNDTPAANLVEIGKSIVKKCKGLPLAIKTLGSILRYETNEMRWRDVLESELWDLEQPRNEVLPALELSYKHMPMYLKRCFVALSLFPKDYDLYGPEMLRLWKLLDLLQSDGTENEDEIGSLYFNELVQRSFLQVDFGAHHKMHDLIHDLACFLAAEEFFRLKGDTSIGIPRNARYISIIEGDASAEILTASHSLRAIVMLPGAYAHINNLEVLSLKCKKLRALTYLPFRRWDMHLPRGIGRLFNLHTLPVTHMCGCSGNMSELRGLNKIRELGINGLCATRIEDSIKAQLQSKKHLQSLELKFSFEMISCANKPEAEPVTVSHEQLLEMLRPHHGLRELKIVWYESPKFPSWLGNASFSNMTKILLFDCKSQHLPTLGELPSLKSLTVHCMDHVKYIGREFCSHVPGVKGFSSLTYFELHWIQELSEWSEVDIGEFRCLRTLLIDCARKLRSLPSVPFISLVTFHLRYCENLAAIPASATLRELRIDRCGLLHQLPTLPSLWKLQIVNCPNLSAVGSLPSLTTLILEGPLEDEMLLYRLLNCHSPLECITIICETTTSIPLQPQRLPWLAKLRLSCPSLQYCHGLAGLTSLKELKLWGCLNLRTKLWNDIRSLLSRQLHNLDIRDEGGAKKALLGLASSP